MLFRSVIKVPLLGDLPIIGWLFKSTTKTKEKTNMVVFLTPKIVRNSGDSNAIISKKLDERLEYIKSEGGKDPYGSRLDEITRKVQGTSSNPPANPVE